MYLTKSIQRQIIFSIITLHFISLSAFAQSVLLLQSKTNVYDNYTESRIVLLNLKEETWVNYKGKNGDFIKISNYFGKEEFYPNGVFEGYVHIKSILDTSTRKEYKNLIAAIPLTTSISIESVQNSSQPESISSIYDIDKYYLGMSEKDTGSAHRSSINLYGYDYKINLHFNASRILSKIELTGKREDAMAVDESIKNQIIQLKNMLTKKNGLPGKSTPYPSFLELEEEKVTNVAIWKLTKKNIYLGIGETNDLYYPRVTFTMN